MQPVLSNDFLKFLRTSGLSRVKLARELQSESPAKSFFQPVVDAIVDMHSNERGAGEEVLDTFLLKLVDPREMAIFPRVIKGYRAFLQSRTPQWFEPPMRDYPMGTLLVRVDPELGLLLGGRPHVLKLYMGREVPTRDDVAATTSLLSRAFQATWPGTVFCLLDVRRGRLHVHQHHEQVGVLLSAEAQSLGTLCALAAVG